MSASFTTYIVQIMYMNWAWTIENFPTSSGLQMLNIFMKSGLKNIELHVCKRETCKVEEKTP